MNILLDNSALSLLSCRRKFQLTVLEGLNNGGNKYSDFGDVLHTVLEHLDRLEVSRPKHKDNLDDALNIGFDKNPNVDRVKLIQSATLLRMSMRLPPPITLRGGSLALEVKFKYPYGSFLINGNKIDIFLAGTIDRIHIDNGILVILDYKSAAAATASSIDKKQTEYDLAFQLPFYVFALLKSGILSAEYEQLIREHKYRTEIMLAFYNVTPPIFKRRIREAFNDDFLYREVPFIINHKVEDAIKVATMTEPAPHDGMCVAKACEICMFRNACLVMGTDKESEILNRFDRIEYNPLTFR